MKRPLRSDTKYTEIEKFKDYEVTQCIAYEMAIRNPKINALVEKRNSIGLFTDLSESQVGKLLKIDNYKKVKEFILSYFKEKPERTKWLEEETILDEEIEKLSYFAIPSAFNKVTNKLLENPYFKSYLEKDSQRNQVKKSKHIDPQNLNIKNLFEDDGMVKTIAGGTIQYDALFPSLSRPIPIIPTKTSVEIDLVLNLALPTKDLTALVELIKKMYEKNSGGIIQVANPLNVVSTIDKEILTISIKTKR